jgi:outer membrane protein insertion porin family
MKPLCRIAFILLAGAIPCTAQATITYTAAKIVFNHPGPYTQAQLEAAAGIHSGYAFNANDLGNAAQRLVDTGYFANVGATLTGMTNHATVLFDIQPLDNSQMIHIGYENFVWLTHAEIEAALRAKSPLFLDYLPENSPLIDTFNDTLTATLAAKGVPAKVTHDTIEPTLHSPARTLSLRVASPAVRVANIKLAGVSPDLVPLVQKSVNSVARTLYTESPTGSTTADRILAPLLDAGYINAALSNIALEPTVSGDSASIVLSATLTPGDIYHASGIAFAGTPLLSADAFAATEKLHPGDIASRALLFQTLAPLDAAYRREGYMDIIIQAAPIPDAATHQVAYTVTATPGEQYRIHDVVTNNLDSAAKADFDRGFLMKSGELFNPEYVATFLRSNTALRALEGYTASYKAYADPNTHTVDLVLTFARNSIQVRPSN